MTAHPSSILRVRGEADREAALNALVDDLLVAVHAAQVSQMVASARRR